MPFPKRTFVGTVSQVRQSPQTIQNVVTYDVVVSVDNTDLELKPGMTAATRVVVDQRDDVIRVPNQALRYAPPGQSFDRGGGQAQIWLLRDGRPDGGSRSLPGLDDDSFTEIVSGDVKAGRPGRHGRAKRDAPAAPRLRKSALAVLSWADSRQRQFGEVGTGHQGRERHADLSTSARSTCMRCAA